MSERIHFGKIKEAIEPPNLIEVQLGISAKRRPIQQAEEYRVASRFQGSVSDPEL
jgi:hypothetical protein